MQGGTGIAPWKFEYIWTARVCAVHWKASHWSLLSQTAAYWFTTNSDRRWLVYGEFHAMKLSLTMEERMSFSVLPWQYEEDLSYYRSFSWAVEPIRIRNLQIAHLPSPLMGLMWCMGHMRCMEYMWCMGHIWCMGLMWCMVHMWCMGLMWCMGHMWCLGHMGCIRGICQTFLTEWMSG